MKMRVSRGRWGVRREEKVCSILWESKNVNGLATWSGLLRGAILSLK